MQHDPPTELDALRLRYLRQAEDDLDLLEEELRREVAPSREALRLSHNLRGTAGCYGLEAVHRTAVALDEALRTSAEPKAIRNALTHVRAALAAASAERPPSPDHAPGTTTAPSNPRLVVAVEDDPGTGLLITKVLERLGCTVECFDDGLRALERLQRGPTPDLLLLDLMLPSVSGHDLARAIARSESFGGTPIVILSAEPPAEVQRLTGELGLLGSLPKPLSIDDLKRVVRHALEAPNA
jgi:two-component system chemotaxis response regulator CheY